MLLCGFVAYCLGDICKTSGVASIIFTGLVLSIYGWYNLSPQGQVTSGLTFRFLGYLSECAIFATIGINIFLF